MGKNGALFGGYMLESSQSSTSSQASSRPERRGGNLFRLVVEDLEYVAARCERLAQKSDSPIVRLRLRQIADFELRIAARLDGTGAKSV